MIFQQILFYIFSFVVIASAIMVVTSRNPVTAVLFLILTFFSSSALFVLIGAEFLAMLLVIVYVGAIAVLFLFVVMMLDINVSEIYAQMVRYLPLGLLVGVILLVELLFILSYVMVPHLSILPASHEVAVHVNNTKAIGKLLYTHYILPFQLGAMVLLVAMIGAIVLTLRQREGVKKQKISRQVSRRVKDDVKVVNVTSRRGV